MNLRMLCVSKERRGREAWSARGDSRLSLSLVCGKFGSAVLTQHRNAMGLRFSLCFVLQMYSGWRFKSPLRVPRLWNLSHLDILGHGASLSSVPIVLLVLVARMYSLRRFQVLTGSDWQGVRFTWAEPLQQWMSVGLAEWHVARQASLPCKPTSIWMGGRSHPPAMTHDSSCFWHSYVGSKAHKH